MSRRLLIRILAGAVALFVVLTTVSVTRYVLAHPNDPLQQNIASWAREKGMGGIVDQLEVWLHDEPPSAAPADTLALAVDDLADTGSVGASQDTVLDTTPDTVPETVATTPSTTPTLTDAPPSNTAAPAKPTRTSLESAPPAVTNPNARPTATVSCNTGAKPTPTTTTTTTIDPTATTTTTSTTTTTTTTVPVTVPGETTTTTTTTTTLPARPDDVAPTIYPALRGEGKWVAAMRVRTKPMVYVSSVRPLWDCGSVVATMAVFNPNTTRAALFNGNETPGGGPWKNGNKIGARAVKSLIASFNGGFRFDHKPGGYVTEGKTVRPLKKGYATFGIRTDGTSTIGIWGDDMTDDGTWVSLRQNLPPLVRDGEIVYYKYTKVDWGKDFDNKVFNFRSAVCRRTDGLMMFVAVGDVNIAMLAKTLQILGCDIGMQMDINGTWPYFAVYNNFGKADRDGRVIDRRMGDPQRHLNKSTKDFIALFDPETLPAGAVK